MKLTYFEMRKSWLKSSTLLFLIIFIAIDIYKINSDFATNNAAAGSQSLIRESKHELYQQLRGKVTQEKIDFIKETSETLQNEVAGFNFSTEYDESRYTGYVFGDSRLFEGDLKKAFRYIVMYSNSSDRVALRAYENIEFYKDVNNKYEQRKNAMIMYSYQGRSLDSFYLTQGSEIFFQYDFSCLLCLCLIGAIFCRSFSMEKEQGIKNLISISAGAKSTVTAKCISACIFCLLISSIFMIVDLFTMNILYNIDGLSQPIYSLYSFEFSPFSISVLRTIFIMVLMRFIVFCIVVLTVMIISSLCNSSLISLVLSFLCIGGLVFLQEHISTFINPIELLSIKKYLVTFQSVNIAGFPFHTIHISFVLYLLIIFLFVFIIHYLNRRRSYAVL